MTQPPNQPPPPGGTPPPPGGFPPPEGPGGPAAPQDPYGMPPPGVPEEPKKSKAGLIIGLAVGVVAVVAAVLVIGFIGLGDDAGDNDNASDDTTSEAADENTDEEPTDEGEAPAEGDIVGDGYSYSLPKGWQDISSTPEVSSQPTLDSGSADAKNIVQSSANVLVELVPASGITQEQLTSQLRTTYETQFGATVENLDDREIGGENTKVLTMTRPSTSNPDVSVEQVSYVLVLDDNGYVITSSRATDFPETEEQVDKILDSWVWE